MNTTKPFLIYRDPKLYDKTTADMANNSANPFMPYNGYVGSKSDIVKMKPAPSDDTVYYLTVSIDLIGVSCPTPMSSSRAAAPARTAVHHRPSPPRT